MSRFVLKTIQRLFSLIGFFSPKKHSKTAVGVFVFVALFGIFLVTTPVHALSMADVANAFLWAFSSIMLALARVCIALSIFALKFFIEIAKYNGYVDTPTVVLGWTMVRDVANMFFVIILLVIAFATILGVEQYEWKKTLVKLVLAAVFINFSKLICGLIIDFAHVFTITFLSAVSATAGGNLINMFHLNDIYKITGKEFSDGTDDVQIEIFIGAVIALLFAGLTLISMGAYLVVMIARVVVLWVLIILSPLAFIMQVLPTTQQWAKEWWDKFGKQVMVAPVMVFFLWLAFATLGTGDFVRNDLKLELDFKEAASVGSGATSGAQKVSISDVSTWENMANFLIAMAFLMVGLGVVNKLGVVGGGMVSSGLSFGKKVATIATGYAAGRWLVGKGKEGAKAGIGKALYNVPFVGGRTIATKAKTTKEAVKGWYFDKGYALTKKGEKMRNQAEGLQKRLRRSKDPAERAMIKRELKGIEKDISKEGAGGIFGTIARSRIREEKQLAKTEKQAGVRKDLLWKRSGSEAGGKVFFGAGVGMGTKGIGVGRFRILGDRFEKDKELAGEVYGKGVGAMDRVERGWLQAESARSKAKDEEYEGLGLRQGLTSARAKFGADGKLGYQVTQGSVQDQIAQHELGAEDHAEAVKNLKSEAKIKVMLGGVKAATGADHEQLLKTQSMAKIIEAIRGAEEKKLVSEHEQEVWEDALTQIKDGEETDAWQMAEAVAEAEKVVRGEMTKHNILLADAEQSEVYDNLGIHAPTTALVEPFEHFAKSFAEMSYDQVMNTYRDSFDIYSDKADPTKPGELTESDKLAMGGLYQRAFDGAYLDDVIKGARSNPQMEQKLKDQLNWKDDEMTPDKLRDAHMMFASGVDLDFVRKNSVVTSLADLAGQEKYGKLSMGVVHEKIRDGSLAAHMDSKSTDYKSDIDALIDKGSILQNNDITTIFGGSDDERKEYMDGYMKVVEDNQAQMQMLGNMRDKAIAKNHSENAGWALSQEVGGQVMYVPMGTAAARDHVLGDLNKTSNRLRAQQHIHASGNLDESTGNITEIRVKEAKTVLSGIDDTRAFQFVPERNKKMHMTISAGEDFGEFTQNDGRFVMAGIERVAGDRAGSTSGSAKTVSNKIASLTPAQKDALATELGVGIANIDNFDSLVDDDKQEIVSRYYLQKEIVPLIRVNPKYVLMNGATAAKIDDRKALNEGLMKLKVHGLAGEGLDDINNIKDIITWYNAHGGPGGTAVATEQRLPEYNV